MKTVEAKSAWFSKINWTQAVAFLAMILSIFGFDLDAKTQTEVLAAIVSIQACVTWFLRTFYNNSVDPSLAGQTVFVDKV